MQRRVMPQGMPLGVPSSPQGYPRRFGAAEGPRRIESLKAISKTTGLMQPALGKQERKSPFPG